MPVDMYKSVMSYILMGKTSVQLDQYVLSTCDATQYPSLYLRLNQTWFEVKPSTYLINATYQNLGDDY